MSSKTAPTVQKIGTAVANPSQSANSPTAMMGSVAPS